MKLFKARIFEKLQFKQVKFDAFNYPTPPIFEIFKI